jgi:hypothetical protein
MRPAGLRTGDKSVDAKDAKERKGRQRKTKENVGWK